MKRWVDFGTCFQDGKMQDCSDTHLTADEEVNLGWEGVTKEEEEDRGGMKNVPIKRIYDLIGRETVRFDTGKQHLI